MLLVRYEKSPLCPRVRRRAKRTQQSSGRERFADVLASIVRYPNFGGFDGKERVAH
jgi:hypothetical protein